MTRDDIIRMAREADIDWHKHWNDDETNRLELFAALVAAAEREACANLCDEMHLNAEDSCGKAADAIRARGK
jgi:hypothetical protein